MPCPCGAVGRKPHTPDCQRNPGVSRQRLWQLSRAKQGLCMKCGLFCYPNPDTGKPYLRCAKHRGN